MGKDIINSKLSLLLNNLNFDYTKLNKVDKLYIPLRIAEKQRELGLEDRIVDSVDNLSEILEKNMILTLWQ